MFDRKLLTKLSRCAWKVLSRYLKQTAAFEDAVPGAVIAVQSFGDFLGINSHLHVIGTDGCFYGNGSFKTSPTPNPKYLEGLFRYEVFQMLKSEGKINDSVHHRNLGVEFSHYYRFGVEAAETAYNRNKLPTVRLRPR